MIKGLEALCYLDDIANGRKMSLDPHKLKLIVEKELKALGIIKEKKVNLEYIKCCETYEQYKTICSYWNEITQKEFNLLKEVLE